jgi:hypothetical protein
VRTGQGEDFVSNVDRCIMLAFVQCLLPPTSQVFVHVAQNACDSSDVPRAFLESGAISKVGHLPFERSCRMHKWSIKQKIDRSYCQYAAMSANKKVAPGKGKNAPQCLYSDWVDLQLMLPKF